MENLNDGNTVNVLNGGGGQFSSIIGVWWW